MPNRSSDTLFQLIKSLKKSEKRNFKLYVTRNSSSEDLKIIQLFDALDGMDLYDEMQLLKKNKKIAKQQLSNIKAHLYREILSSLRLIKNDDNIDIQLHEQLDFARILYNKGLYLQSLKTLDKIKETALENNQLTFLLQVLFFEKKIEALHITRSMQDRAEQLTAEVDTTNKRLQLIGNLSNLSLQVLFFEKKIEALHITRSMQDRAEQLTAEVDTTNKRLQLIGNLSNLSLQL